MALPFAVLPLEETGADDADREVAVSRQLMELRFHVDEANDSLTRSSERALHLLERIATFRLLLSAAM
ncbi:MAG: hypothetical protein JWL80_617 [Parcubacteria group bacterium]|nr:hypothetical protein [Parcubacteria group bacterium]